MPEKPRTRTQIQAEVHDYCRAHGLDRTDSAVRRMAVKWKRREDEKGERIDFYEGLRILGITADPTPLAALAEIAKEARSAV